MSDNNDVRFVPELPVPGKKIHLLIDTDAGAEVDDQYGIALALLMPERFQIEGFVASHFRNSPSSIPIVAEEIKRVMAAAGMPNKYPVKLGAHPLQYETVPTEGEGPDFIIDRAMAASSGDRLWIVSLGGVTSIASAYLKRPEIANRSIVLWHTRSKQWPERCSNSNFARDARASCVLFSSKMPLVMFDSGTYLRMPIEESEKRIRPLGELGRFLHDIRLKGRPDEYTHPKKGFFDMGDIAALADPTLVDSDVDKAPEAGWDGFFNRKKDLGQLRRIYQIDNHRTWDLLIDKMKAHCGRA